jgi:hypothetical protein
MSRISNSLTTVLTNLLTMMFWDECLYCPVPVPMEVLFAPQKEQARLSSDGQFLAYLGPSAAEVSNVWVQPINGTEEEAKMVTKETHRGVIS